MIIIKNNINNKLYNSYNLYNLLYIVNIIFNMSDPYRDSDGPRVDETNKCIIDSFGGKGHPYSYCIKNTDDISQNAPKANPAGLDRTGAYVGAILDYGEGLICSPELSVKNECKAILGNRYILRTGQECQEVDVSDGVPTGEIRELSKYINNESDGSSILTGGAATTCKGIIPSTLGSVSKINAFGILGAFVGPTTPYCMQAQVKCHLIDNKLSSNSFTGFTKAGETYLNICDLYNHIKDSDLIEGTKPAGLSNFNVDGIDIEQLCGGFLAEAGITAFTNMNLNPESSQELGGCQSTKWGCCPGQNQLFGKAKLDKKGSNCNNIQDNDKNIIDTIFNTYSNNKNQNNNFFENDNIINLYIISISLLFMFIIFKLITKKK